MKRLLAIGFIALGFAASGARADAIGTPTNPCVNNSCFGSIYTLEYSIVSATEYLVRLLIDTTGYTGLATNYIQGVSIKPASSILATSSLVSTSAPGAWTVTLGGLANGCTGSGGGYICAQDGVSAVVGPTYEWIFDIKVASASDWLLTAGAASVKANYDPAQGLITSEPITLQYNRDCCQQDVPEPQSLALLGMGLFALLAIRRRVGA